MRVGGYGRVSTAEQRDSGLGLDAQRTAVEAEASRRGWGPVCWSEDAGVSASVPPHRRPELAALLAAADAGLVEVVVAARLDRLTRSVADLAALLERAQRHGWTLVVVDAAGVDTTSPSGRLMAQLLGAFAEYERALIGARTRDALAAARDRGTRLGRPVTLQPEVRDRIAAEHESGRSLRAIAQGLTDDKVPTSHGGVRWYASTVAAVLRSVEHDRQQQTSRCA